MALGRSLRLYLAALSQQRHVSLGLEPYYYGQWTYAGGQMFWVPQEPWGWILGSGIYIDDVNAVFRAEVGKYAVVVSVIMVIILFLFATSIDFRE
jgi:hypothetical protein